MATINPSFVPQPGVYQNTPAGPTTEAQAAAQAVQAQSQALPFIFVNGEPPADAGLVPPATYTAGLALPAVDPRQWSAQSGSLDLSNVTTTTGVMNVQAQVMALQDVLMKMMLVLRTSSLNNREDELQTMIKQKTVSIEKGLDAAFKDMMAGILGGVAEIAAGVGSLKGAKAGEGVANAMGQVKVAVGTNSSYGTIASGFIKVAAAVMGYGAALDKADQQRADLRADVANARMQQANEQAAAYLENFKAFKDGQLQIQRDLTESSKRTFV